MDERTLKRLQRFRAEEIPANAIRNQGAKGVLEAIHAHLARLRLATFAVKDRRSFDRRLRVATDRLVKKLEVKCSIEDRWGVARKSLNLFLRDCTYDHHLRSHYHLGKIEPWLEVPLDSFVANALRGTQGGRKLPRWDSLIELKAEVSHKYQEVAHTIADRRRIARVHLDLRYWTEGRERRKRAFAGGMKKLPGTMCGCFTLSASAADLVRQFDLDDLPAWSPRYNIAPTQEVLAVLGE